MIWIIFLALATTITWVFITIKWKELQNRGIKITNSFGIACAGLPLWIATLIFLHFRYEIIYSQQYFTYLTLWAIPVIISTLGMIYLIKFHALSEYSIYKLGFSALLAVILDILIFQVSFTLAMIVGLILLFASGIILSKSKKQNKKKMKLYKTLSVIFILSIIGTFQLAFYKLALLIQPNPIVHAMIGAIFVYTILIIFLSKSIYKDYKKGEITNKDFALLGFSIYLITILEAFLIYELPISLVIVLAVLQIFLLAIYDIKKKEFHLSWELYTAGILCLIALILITA